jgi:hypothetical protein
LEIGKNLSSFIKLKPDLPKDYSEIFYLFTKF